MIESRRIPSSGILVLAAIVFGGGVARADEPQSLRVAVVQMRSTADLNANVRHTIELLERAAKERVQVAVFPECSLTGYLPDVIPKLSQEQIAAAVDEVAKACGRIGIAAVIGSPWREGDKLYNSAIILDERGRTVERYHKVQLAENWPVGGDHLSVYKLFGVPCTTIVCHDERYPELVRLPVLAGARVVFYISHESGVRFESKLGPYRAQIQARAVENTVYVAQSNAPANDDATGSHGQSRLIAPDGNILQEATAFGEELLVADFDLTKATGAMAKRSTTRGPLTKWYEEGVRQVRVIP